MSEGPSATITDYLADHAVSRRLLDEIHAAVAKSGPVDLRWSKSQVAFRRQRNVAVAWAPGQYLDGEVAPLVITVALPFRDESPRWKEIVEPHPGTFVHHLELRSVEDVDDELTAWLHSAWEAAE